MSTRMQHCAWCGEELGVYDAPHGERDHCGNPECAKEVRDSYRQEREEAMDEAERHDYGRYR